MDERSGLPSWWKKNVRLKAELGLPEYEPPRFSDGVYTHTVTEDLEKEFDCTVRFVGFDTSASDRWDVLVNGRSVLKIDKKRDGNGNSIYEMRSGTFRETVVSEITSKTDG